MKITIEAVINADTETVWDTWITPEEITQWNAASDDWHTPRCTNDLCVDGRFSTRMEAKDGSVGFDFEGTYTKIEPYELIEYVMDDKRVVTIEFISVDSGTKVTETFEAEDENAAEMQRNGWQSILNNFKKHVESKD